MFRIEPDWRGWYLALSVAFCLAVLGWFLPVPQGARKPSKESGLSSYRVRQYENLPISFEPNRQQFDSRFQFIARGASQRVLLKADTAVLQIGHGSGKHTVQFRFNGAASNAAIRGDSKLGGEANYFSGTPDNWITHVPLYQRVYVDDLYPGVDLTYYGSAGRLEYDLIVKPGSDPTRIDLAFEGTPMQLADGDLVLAAGDSQIRQKRPVVYQEIGGTRRFVDAKYVVRGEGRVGFNIGRYDHGRPLIIDPQLIYSLNRFFEKAYGVAIDGAGNAYICGTTLNGFSGGTSALVVKLNSTGTAVIYSNTFGAREGGEQANGIAVDTGGNSYVTGFTPGSEPGWGFPTVNPIQPVQPATTNVAFVTKFGPTGSMIYSTVLGGSGVDSGSAIAVDSMGNMYVAGSTTSTDFPTSNPMQSSLRGPSDAFVTALNAQGNAFIFSTYVGGSGDDRATGIAVDASGNSYVSGTTSSADFPTANPINASASGGFAFKLNPAGSAFQYSTYLGETAANGIAIDSFGSAYVVGATGAPSNAFAKKINSTGSAFVYSAYIGGSSDDYGSAIAVDATGNAYITGRTVSPDFPQVASLETFVAGSTDAFLTKLSTTGTIAYSTLLAGNSDRYLGGTAAYNTGQAVASDASGNVYVAGWTTAWNFPVTPGTATRSWIDTSVWDASAFLVKLTNDMATSPITLVQSTAVEGSSLGSLSVRFPSANTAGNLIIAFVRMSTTWEMVNVRDTAGNMYIDAVSQGQTADGHQIHIFYAKNIVGGSNTVTATFSSTNNHPWIAVYEYSGLSTTNPLDQTAHTQGSSNSPFSGLITTTADNELEFAATGLPASYTGTVAPGGGYTLMHQDTGTSRAATETDVLTHAANDYAGRFFLSSNTNWTIAVATFVAAGPLHITTQTLPNGQINTPYSAQISATGGAAPYSWSVTPGSLPFLPSGLRLNSSTGVLSGTPTQSGQFTFTVAVTDATSHTSYRFMNLLIPNPPTMGTVQSNTMEGSGVGSVSVPFRSNTTPGNLIVAFVRMSTTYQTVTVTDTAGNVYTEAASQVQSSDGHQIHVFYAKNIAGGADTVSATFSSTNNHPWLAVIECEGLSTTNPFDQAAHAQGYSSTPNSGSIAPASQDLLLVATGLPASFRGTVSWANQAPWLQDTGTSRAAAQFEFSSPGSPVAAQFALSSPANWTAVVVAFKQ